MEIQKTLLDQVVVLHDQFPLFHLDVKLVLVGYANRQIGSRIPLLARFCTVEPTADEGFLSRFDKSIYGY